MKSIDNINGLYKKLLQINTTCNSGSTGRIAEQISLLAETHGWDCYIAHGARYVKPSRIKTIPIGNKLENYVHAFLGEYLGLHGFGSTIGTWLFLRKVKKIKPDIVHLHNLHGYYINIRLLFNYLAKADIPVVWTLHDCWSFTGHCTHFENKGCYKWETECGDCPLLMAQYKSRIFDRSRSNFRIKKALYGKQKNLTIIPVSYWLGNLVKRSILKNHDVRVINNGIDLTLFKPTANEIRKKLRIPDGKKLILGVVSSGFKGKKEFIEIAKDSSYQVVVVGVKKSWMEGVPSNIICVGRTDSQKELAEYYTAADVFVTPTYDDTFPTTNIEAMACGTPVVTYLAGGSPETIDENTGMAVPRGDIVSLKKSIDRILAHGKDCYSKACRERAEKYFNKDERFIDYIKLYGELVND